RKIFELRPVANLRPRRPFADYRKEHVISQRSRGPTLTHRSRVPTLTLAAVVGRVRSSQQLKVVARLIEPMEAPIIGAALHTGGGEWNTQRLTERRDVFEENLFLQVLRS